MGLVIGLLRVISRCVIKEPAVLLAFTHSFITNVYKKSSIRHRVHSSVCHKITDACTSKTGLSRPSPHTLSNARTVLRLLRKLPQDSKAALLKDQSQFPAIKHFILNKSS